MASTFAVAQPYVPAGDSGGSGTAFASLLAAYHSTPQASAVPAHLAGSAAVASVYTPAPLPVAHHLHRPHVAPRFDARPQPPQPQPQPYSPDVCETPPPPPPEHSPDATPEPEAVLAPAPLSAADECDETSVLVSLSSLAQRSTGVGAEVELLGHYRTPNGARQRTPTAQRHRPSGVPVEERLLKAKAAYDERRAAKQREADERQRAACTGHPVITAAARRWQPELPAYERLATPRVVEDPEGPAAFAATLRDQSPPRARDAPAGVGGTPRINRRSRDLAPRGAEGFAAWAEERELRRQQAAARAERAQREEASGRPTINTRPRPRHATPKATRRAPVPVEDRLLQWQRDAKGTRAADAAEAGRLAERARAAKTAALDGTAAASRLFHDAHRRDTERDERRRVAELMAAIEPGTGRVRFHPELAPASAASAVAPRVMADSPHHRQASPPRRSSPRVGVYSAALAELKLERDGTADVPVHDRLATPKMARSTAQTPPPRRVTAKVAAGELAARAAVEGLLQRQRQHEAGLRRQRQEREQQELARCTFTPMTTERRYGPQSEGEVERGDFFDRQSDWAVRRERKVAAQRVEKQRREEADVAAPRPY